MALLKKYRWILLLILFSLIIRVSIFTHIMNNFPYVDFFAYKEWIYKSYSFGLNNVYSIHSNNGVMDVNQPPGTIYILRGSYEVFLLTTKVLTHSLHLKPGATGWIEDKLLVFFFRLPSIVADLILGFSIYLVVKSKTKEKIALISSAFYLLGPPIIYNSTVWGQIDSINNLFFYLSLIFLIKKQALPSFLFLSFSLFVKLSLLPLVPLYLLFGLYFFKPKQYLISLVSSVVIILLLCLPFSLSLISIVNIFEKSLQGVSNDISSNAYNFWWLILNPTTSLASVSTLFWKVSLDIWAKLLFLVFYIPLFAISFLQVRNKKIPTDKIFLFLALGAFVGFLFLPKMHERYLYPVLPLLITYVGIKNKYWISLVIISVVHFLNLYVVWNPNLILFRNYEVLINSSLSKWVISFVTVVSFIILYLKVVLDYRYKTKLFKNNK